MHALRAQDHARLRRFLEARAASPRLPFFAWRTFSLTTGVSTSYPAHRDPAPRRSRRAQRPPTDRVVAARAVGIRLSTDERTLLTLQRDGAVRAFDVVTGLPTAAGDATATPQLDAQLAGDTLVTVDGELVVRRYRADDAPRGGDRARRWTRATGGVPSRSGRGRATRASAQTGDAVARMRRHFERAQARRRNGRSSRTPRSAQRMRSPHAGQQSVRGQSCAITDFFADSVAASM